MPQNAYVIHKKPENGDRSKDAMYFSYSDGPVKNKPPVSVDRSISGIYDLPSDNSDSNCTYSLEFGDESNTSKESIFVKTKKLLILGILIILVVIFVAVLIGVFDLLSDHHRSKDCKTIRVISSFNPDPGEKCIFPFIYKDEKFSGCTQADYDGTYWCPTELLADGSFQKSSSKWGTCENKCHKEDSKHTTRDTILPGTFLNNGQNLASKNGIYHLWMQKDGDLELHKNIQGNWKAIWASRTTAKGDEPYKLYLNETNLQLEIHDHNNDVVWNSNNPIPNGNDAMHEGRAVLENNGNFVVYDGQNSIVWSTQATEDEVSITSYISIEEKSCSTIYDCESNDESVKFCNFDDASHGVCEACPSNCSRKKFHTRKGREECKKVCEGFEKIAKRYCVLRIKNKSYDTLLDAKLACLSNPKCKGVYERYCINMLNISKFELCDESSEFLPSYEACVHAKLD